MKENKWTPGKGLSLTSDIDNELTSQMAGGPTDNVQNGISKRL